MKCSGFQYEIGKKYKIEKIDLCSVEFHFCYDLQQCFNFYKKESSRFFKVKIEVDQLYGSFNEKLCSNNIEFLEEITGLENADDFKGSFE